ncbi:alanine--tRNA ligase [Candidatus Gottesmanbacteria bacterium]|nr:alanine--tRNA ligase [Candidatus Gottesmanbacteria bacterium]
MNSADVRKKYLEFFKKRGHAEIPSAPLVPENDPTTLFTSSGMQPLIPYLLGQPHPLGKRLVDSQKSFRSQDIDEVGDNRHTTFFEMLGNWSLGDYFKKEQLPWIFEFLTKELGLDPKRLYVTVFEGGNGVTKDTESIEIWKEVFRGVGIEAKEGERIFAYPAKKNWWSRSGEPQNMPPGEPGGPDSEVFFDFGEQLKLHEQSPFKNEKCHPNCDCGRFLEIANSVFMQYQKMEDGSLKELKQKNVDFGGGLERMIAAVNDDPDIFKTDMFTPLIHILENVSGIPYGGSKGSKESEGEEKTTRAMRIISDHMRASVMMMADGVLPSNKTQGYVLRRLIRRSLLYGRKLGLSKDLTYIGKLVAPIAQIYEGAYPTVTEKAEEIKLILQEEALRFGKTLERGLAEIEKVKTLDGKIAFMLYETYGFPWEMTEEIAREKGQQVDKKQFEQEFKKHQELSRTAAAGMFKGGLADKSEATVALHTAHHLLLAALQKIVDPGIRQRGSNITAERLRMDFNFARKLTPEELKKVEDLVNQKIAEDLPVVRKEMKREEAEKIGAQMEFGHKYPDVVSVYIVGSPSDFFSAEFCGGPHVGRTGTIGRFKIKKEESAASGIRRIYASVE